MDIITTKSTLQNVFEFVDGDTRIVNVDDPQDSLTAEAVQEWAAFAVTNQILLGDKTAAALSGIKSSKKINATDTNLDLS